MADFIMELYLYDRSKSDLDIKKAREYLYDFVIRDTFGKESPKISKNSFGKPYFLKPFDGHYFNISHSGNLVIMAIGDMPVGVDVERIGRAKDYMKLAKRFFYDHEFKRLLKIKNSEEEFYRIWTFREAFSKNIGDGLAIFYNNDIYIDYKKNTVIFDGIKYVFYEYGYPGYRITVCLPFATDMPALKQVY